MSGVIRVGFRASRDFRFQGAIGHRDFTRLAVQLEEDRAPAIGMGLADSQVTDDERLAHFDIDRDLLAGLEAVEERGRRQDAGVRKLLLMPREVDEDFLVKQVRNDFAARWLVVQQRANRGGHLLKVGGGQACARSATQGLFAA